MEIEMISVRTALIILGAVMIGVITGFLTYSTTSSVQLALIGSGTSFAGSVKFLNDFIK